MRLIDIEALDDMDFETCDTGDWYPIIERIRGRNHIRKIVKDAPAVDAVPVCRCAECKHRPTKPDDYNPITTDGFALEFPDEKCPCQCSDGWYSKYPDDDWYCPIGERKGEDEEAAK